MTRREQLNQYESRLGFALHGLDVAVCSAGDLGLIEDEHDLNAMISQIRWMLYQSASGITQLRGQMEMRQEDRGWAPRIR